MSVLHEVALSWSCVMWDRTRLAFSALDLKASSRVLLILSCSVSDLFSSLRLSKATAYLQTLFNGAAFLFFCFCFLTYFFDEKISSNLFFKTLDSDSGQLLSSWWQKMTLSSTALGTPKCMGISESIPAHLLLILVT
jgi:hypothetical protein